MTSDVTDVSGERYGESHDCIADDPVGREAKFNIIAAITKTNQITRIITAEMMVPIIAYMRYLKILGSP